MVFLGSIVAGRRARDDCDTFSNPMSEGPAELAAAVGGNSISFAEIVKGRDSTVRVTVDGHIYAVDLVMVMTGKNINDSNECLRELNPS